MYAQYEGLRVSTSVEDEYDDHRSPWAIKRWLETLLPPHPLHADGDISSTSVDEMR